MIKIAIKLVHTLQVSIHAKGVLLTTFACTYRLPQSVKHSYCIRMIMASDAPGQEYQEYQDKDDIRIGMIMALIIREITRKTTRETIPPVPKCEGIFNINFYKKQKNIFNYSQLPNRLFTGVTPVISSVVAGIIVVTIVVAGTCTAVTLNVTSCVAGGGKASRIKYTHSNA